MELCANNPSEWVLGVTSNGPMAKGVCKEGKRKEENLKRRNLERESGKVLLVAFVDSWMRGSAWCRHDPQSRSSGVFHTVCRSLQDHQ